MRSLVAAAITARSGGNMQPWKFYWDGETLHVVHDRARDSSPTLDIGRRATDAALGAAVENVVSAAASQGRLALIEWLPKPEARRERVVARIRFESAEPSRLDHFAALHPYVGQRVTNRRLGPRKTIAPGQVEALLQAASDRGAELHLCRDPATLETLAGIFGELDCLRMFTPQIHRELMSELRFSRREAEETRDGIDVATLELPKSQQFLIGRIRNPRVARALGPIGLRRTLLQDAKTLMNASAAVGVLTVPGVEHRDYLEGGRAMQRVWLTAIASGLTFQPLAAATYLFTRLTHFGGEGLAPELVERLSGLYERFEKCFPIARECGHVLYFRLGSAGPPSARSLRRPVDVVLHDGEPK